MITQRIERVLRFRGQGGCLDQRFGYKLRYPSAGVCQAEPQTGNRECAAVSGCNDVRQGGTGVGPQVRLGSLAKADKQSAVFRRACAVGYPDHPQALVAGAREELEQLFRRSFFVVRAKSDRKMRGHAADAGMGAESACGDGKRSRGEGTSYRRDPGADFLRQSARQAGEHMQRTVFVVWRHGGIWQEREDWFPVRLPRMPDIEYDERAATIQPAAVVTSGMRFADLMGYLIRQLLDETGDRVVGQAFGAAELAECVQ
jgi:hypothetical protein